MAEDKNLQKKLAKFAEEIMNIARSECSTIEEETQSDLLPMPKPPSISRQSSGKSTDSPGLQPSVKRTA